jgi:hypothetical protein
MTQHRRINGPKVGLARCLLDLVIPFVTNLECETAQFLQSSELGLDRYKIDTLLILQGRILSNRSTGKRWPNAANFEAV